MIGELIETLTASKDLSQAQSRELFADVFHGGVSEVTLSAVLVALKGKGETPEEIAGAAEAMRDAATAFDFAAAGDLSLKIVDSAGTGGDGAETVNISTAAALLCAEMGLKVVKHGNRSISSKCGSADVLEACGVAIEAERELSLRCLEQLNICFLFAPSYHPGMRFAMPVRRSLGVRTIFNLLGPLSNPARPHYQLVGVYHPRLCRPMAETLALLGCKAALVVHGAGLDELALHDETEGALLRDGQIQDFRTTPEELGLSRAPLLALRGGEAQQNARWLQELLAGDGDKAHAQAVALNAGALYWVAGKAESLAGGVQTALDVLEDGGAAVRLERWSQMR
jgi:anthranilate phosphoribosyltransferase